MLEQSSSRSQVGPSAAVERRENMSAPGALVVESEEIERREIFYEGFERREMSERGCMPVYFSGPLNQVFQAHIVYLVWAEGDD